MSVKIILGSQSSNRKAVLERAGYQFEVMTADIDEKAIRLTDPLELTLAIANAKADVLLPKIGYISAILITADTVVVCDNKVLEKPVDENEAREFFKKYTVFPIQIITAVTVTNVKTKLRKSTVDVVEIKFKPFSDDEVDLLIKEDRVFNFAGGFTVLDPLVKEHIALINGEEDSSAGLPMKIVEDFIKCLT